MKKEKTDSKGFHVPNIKPGTTLCPSVWKEGGMLPSEKDRISNGQIERIADILRDILRKNRSEFDFDDVQSALDINKLGPELLEVFRTYVNEKSKLIVLNKKPR